MTDIVERLRKASVYEERSSDLSNLGDESADEIERLREASLALQEVLTDIEEYLESREWSPLHSHRRRLGLLAALREALGERP